MHIDAAVDDADATTHARAHPHPLESKLDVVTPFLGAGQTSICNVDHFWNHHKTLVISLE